MTSVGDITVTQAWTDPSGTETVVFRITDEVDGKGVETSGTEHICSATAAELAEAGVDPSDADALKAYLGRGLLPKQAPVQRTDLLGAISVNAIATKEAARLEAVEVAKAEAAQLEVAESVEPVSADTQVKHE